MKGWEILSRGTATLIRTTRNSSRASASSLTPTAASTVDAASLMHLEDEQNDVNLQMIASHHVTHPFRFPHYYKPEDYPWMEILTEKHIKQTVEWRDEYGEIMGQVDIDSPIFGHPSRDFSVSNMGIGTLQSLQVQVQKKNKKKKLDALSFLTLAPQCASDSAPLTFHGHFLKPQMDTATLASSTTATPSTTTTTTTTDESLMQPRVIPGKLFLRSPNQVFAKTAEILEMGMCGGPVVTTTTSTATSTNSPSVNITKNECVGVIEGIVHVSAANENNTTATTSTKTNDTTSDRNNKPNSMDKVKQVLSGCAVFVECDVLRPFLDEIATDRRIRR